MDKLVGEGAKPWGMRVWTHHSGRRWILKRLPDLNPKPVQHAHRGVLIEQLLCFA